jgi:hypothetical protein
MTASARSLTRRLLFALLVVPFCGGLAGADDLTKEFKSANVRWTLPNAEYTWQELSDDETKSGYIGRAVSDDKNVTCFGMAGDSGGLALSDRMEEMTGALQSYAGGGVSGVKQVGAVLAGLDGRCVVIAGRSATDVEIQVRGYGIEAGGRMYHLILIIQNDVQKERQDELNALREGFQLIKGGGTKEAVETFDEVGGGSRSADDGAGDGEAWPEKGPVRDGDKLTFTNYNLEWTLPKDGPFSWRSPIRDLANMFKREGNSVLISPGIRTVARLERKKGEFEGDDTPTHNELLGLMFLFELEGGYDSAKWVRDPEFDRKLEKENGFTNLNSAKSRVVDSVPIGNSNGVMVLRDGEMRGVGTTLVYFEVVLRGWLYRWYFWIQGYEPDRLKQFQEPIQKLMAGVHFPESVNFVEGPLIATDGLATFGGKRGDDVDKEKEYNRAGYSWSSKGGYSGSKGLSFKKPEGLAYLGGGERGLQLAVEGRSEDGQAYIYFSVWTEATGRLQNEGRSEESIVDDHAKAWLSTLGDSALCSKSGKTPYYKNGAFEGAKGLKYEFTATYDDKPYVEEGYVVKQRQNTYWIRIQFGGENAEKKLGKLFKAIKKGFAWDR